MSYFEILHNTIIFNILSLRDNRFEQELLELSIHQGKE